MTTPKRIRFMGYTFRVVQETEHTEDEERYGLIDYRTQTIQLNRNTSDERKQLIADDRFQRFLFERRAWPTVDQPAFGDDHQPGQE